MAQPVPVRPVPAQPWGPILLVAFVLFAGLLVLWEWRMRSLGLEAGDLEDGPSSWAEQRHRLDDGEAPVAIVGDSRILFDTDLDRFQALTGVRPVQLALPGTNARPFLQQLAGDERFKGLAIVGIADRSYFRDDIGLMGGALDAYHFQSPSRRSGFLLDRWLQQRLAFLDDQYRLSTLVHRLDIGRRKGAWSPQRDVWKVRTSGEDRQSFMWSRIEGADPRLRLHARQVWLQAGPARARGPVPADVITRTIRLTRQAVARIRARGGEVVFVRPPSTGPVRVAEEKSLPRASGWDRLLVDADVRGIHFEDHASMQGLDLPEWSHLSRRCASVYTDAYVREVARLGTRLRLRDGAPPPLQPSDCEPQMR